MLVDGVYGGLTPSGLMHVAVFNERQASGDNVRLIRKKIAAAFAVTKSPTK